jgi:uncharacterized repeat protein (TIGR01451 family)/fimbrial isopeptide formation D2 family protein
MSQDSQNSPLPHSLFESLEERVLFDGVPDAQIFIPQADGATPAPAPAQGQEAHIADAGQRTELIFVDPGVENSDALLSEIMQTRSDQTFEIRMLDGGQDGILQMTEFLSQAETKYDAIHVISHGDDGQVHLGNTTLEYDNLSKYADEFSSWSSALTEDADLLFYGCDLASTDEGKSLLDSISAVTGADVAASDDLTGDADLSGDWDLEFTVGVVETATFSATAWNGVLAGAIPTATIDLPAEEMINESFEFSVTFLNTSTTGDNGFAPFVDLSVEPGVDVGSANYLGSPVTMFQVGEFDGSGNLVDGLGGPVTHPLTGLAVTGTPGEVFYVVELPFGSFVPGQPSATVTFDATTDGSAGAVVGTPIDIDVTGGFALGCDPLDNDTTDPAIFGATTTSSITPQVIDLVKESTAPEDERSTGPNFPITYSLTINVADGETVTELDITDALPNSFVYVGGSLSVDTSNATAASGVVISSEPVAGSPQNAPDNGFLIEIGSVTGSAAENDIVVQYTIWVDEFDADGNPVINDVSGNDVPAVNDASVTGNYATGIVGDNDALTDDELSQQSISTQKNVAVVNDVGAAGVTPGDTLEYTIQVQVSDYFEFSDVFLDDSFSDGQLFDATFVPTYVISEGGTVTSGSFAASNYTVTQNSPGDGSTDVFFDVAAEVPDGVLTGDLFADASLDGGTTVTVTFRTVIQESYTDLPGDLSVDTGDILTNTVGVTGTLPSGQTETDGSGTSVAITGSNLSKVVYAVNGDTGRAGEPTSAGTTLTYRIQFDMATADFENLILTDFLPLPLYDATEITTLSTTPTGTPPPAGTITYGANHDLHTVAGVTPTISTDAATNSLAINFGTFDVDPSVPATIDLLFTVTAQDLLMADGLFITNQANATFDSTNNGSVTTNAIAQNQIAAPVLALTKGIVSTDAVSPTFNATTVGPVAFAQPGTAGAAFAGGINSTSLAANPIDSNLVDADAGDLVKFAIVVENTGGADGFNLLIQDTLPPNSAYVTPAGGLNLEVRDGDGNLLTYTGAAGDLFGAGIEIVDPSALTGAIGDRDDAALAGDGSNIIVITYDLELNTSVNANSIYTNNAELAQFGAVDGGGDHTAGSNNADWTDDATVETLNFVGAKSIVATSEAHTGFVSGIERVTIGEIIRYRLVTELPEVTVDSLILRDLLPAGLEFINDGTSTLAFVSDGGVTSTAVGTLNVNVGAVAFVAGDETTVSTITPTYVLADNNIGSTASTNSNTDNFNSGTDVYFKLGEITNADDDANKEYAVVEFNALVLNSGGSNDQNDVRNNRFRVQDGNSSFGDSTQVGVRIAEPLIDDVNKVATPTTGDAGDVVTFTVTFSNDGSTLRSDAFDVNVIDSLPPEFTLVGGSVVVTTAGGSNGVIDNTAGNVIDIDIDHIPNGGSITIEYQGMLVTAVQPGQVVTNQADVTYTSLPGTGTAANPTGSTTTGASGDVDGERDGESAGVYNDYSDSDTAQVTIFAPTVQKSLVSTSIVNSSNTNNQAVIGELATYEVEITVPEGTINTAQLIDDLDAGLTFVSLDSITASAGVTSSTVDLNNAATIAPGFVLQQVSFDLGDVTNTNNSNATAETITIRYTVRVEDVVSNQSGSALDNVVSLAWMLDGTTPMMSNTDDAEDIQVIEPDLVVNKGVSAGSADANDPVTFTITIGHSGTSDTDAFDVTFSDPVPTEITWNMAGVTATHSTLGDISALFQQTGNTLETIPGSSFDILAGETVTIVVAGAINQSVTPGQTLSNTATADWSSLDGTDPNERDGGDGESGALDDYEDDSTAAITIVGSPILTKDVVGTSINDANNDDTEVVIGELVQYRLYVTLPEATIPGANFVDNLDLGLEFVSLDSVTTYSGAVNFPTTVTSSQGLFTNTALFNPTVTGDGTATAQNLEFDFGTITNASSSNTELEALEVIYTVRVNNIPSNTSNGSAIGQLLDNSATFNWEDSSGALLGTSAATAPAIEVIEPELNITKVISDATPHLGQTVDYTITISHTTNSDADAYDLHLTDLVPAGMTLDLGSINVAGANVVLPNSLGNTINLVLDELAIGDTITLTYEATVTTDAAQIGSNLNNTASTTWTSIPDGDTTGSTDERDGDSGNAGEDDYVGDVTETAVLTHPQVELVKELVSVAPASSGVDGNFDVTYEFEILSVGNDPLTNVSLLEDLATQYGSSFEGIVLQGGSPAVITTSTASNPVELNANFDGDTDTEIFDNSGSNTNSIAMGEIVVLQIIIEVDPNAGGANANGDLVNQAQVTATGGDTGIVVTDLSDDPDDPTESDPNGDGNADDSNEIRFPNISLLKQVVGAPVPASSATAGNFDVTYEFTITNTGSTALDTLILNENLNAHFGGAFVGIVPDTFSGAPAVITASTALDVPGINGSYDGTAANQNIFDGSSASLLVNQSVTVQITVELDPDSPTGTLDQVSGDGSGDFENQASVTATDSGDPSTMVSDNSDDPTDGDDTSDDLDADPDSPTGLILSDITLTKTQVGSVIPATSGTSGNYEVTYDLAITNTGGQALNSLSLIEDLQSNYAGAFVGIVPQGGAVATIVSPAVSDNPEINASYDGTTANSQLFDNTGGNTSLLDIGETVVVRIVIEIDPDNATANLMNGSLVNQASTEGTGVIDGSTPNDLSDDPNDAADDGAATDNNPDDPNELSIAEIELEKQVTGTPVIATSGTFGNFDITYTFEITNTGTETLSSISLTDDLATQLGGVFVDVVSINVVEGSATSAPAANGTGPSAYDGTAGSDMLVGAATDELQSGESFTVTLVIEIDPDSPTANYNPDGVIENSAMAAGDGENGGSATDVSDDPTDAQDVQAPTDPGNDPDDPTPLYVPAIGLAKTAGDAVANGDDWDVTFTLLVENNGTVDLNNLSLFDDVAAQFGPAFDSASGLAIQNFNGLGVTPGVNGVWSGDTSLDMLDGSGQLDVGGSFEIVFTITIDPDGIDGVSQALNNQANITGDALDENGLPIDDGMGGTLGVSDVSDNGVDTDSENGEDNVDGTPGNDPTPIIIADIATTKALVGSPVANGENFDVTFDFIVENVGTVDLYGVDLIDDLSTQLGAAFVEVNGLPSLNVSGVVAGTAPTLNTSYDGSIDINLLNSDGFLAPGDFVEVTLTITIDPDATGTSSDLTNQATGGGTDSGGNGVTDLSDNGTDPNSDNGTGTTDDPTPISIGDIGVGKQLNGVTPTIATGVFDAQYAIVIENTGSEALNNIQLTDDLAAEFGPSFAGIISVPAITITGQTLSTGSSVPTVNGSWDGGATDANLFDGATGLLAPGDSFTLVFTIQIDSNLGDPGPDPDFTNQVTASGYDPSGNLVTDLSDDGLNPNSDNGIGGTDDPTPLLIPQIRALKSHGVPTANADGTYSVPVLIDVANTGTTVIENLTLVDDVASEFGDAFISVGSPTIAAIGTYTGTLPTINPVWSTANTSADLLDPLNLAETLEVGESFRVTFTVVVDPDAVDGASTPLNNQATVSGDGLNYDNMIVTVSDQSGEDSLTDGSGVDNDLPTALEIPELRTTKEQTAVAANGDEFDITFDIRLENTGTVDLTGLDLFDDLDAQFGPTFNGVITTSIDTSAVSNPTPPTLNTNFNGDSDINLLNNDGLLNPGEFLVVTVTVTVDPDAAGAPVPLENQATGAGDDPNGIETTDPSDSGSDPNSENIGAPNDSGGHNDPTPLQIPDISAAKQVIGTPTKLANGNFEAVYQVVVKNTGTVELVDLTLQEDLATQFGASYEDAYNLTLTTPPGDPASNVALDSANWNGGSDTEIVNVVVPSRLAVADTFIFEFTVEIDPAAATGVLENTVTAGATAVDENGDAILGNDGVTPVTVTDDSDSGTDPSDENPGAPGDMGTSDDPTPLVIPAADLVTVKTLASGDSTPAEGEVVAFTIAVTNDGPDDATGVSLSDLLPAGLTATANNGTTASGTYDATTGLWNIGDIASGATVTLTLEGTVDVGEGGNTITNITTAAFGDQADTSTVGDDLEEEVVVENLADLVTEKTLVSGNATPAEGDSVTFQIAVTNNGAAQASNVSLTDQLPAGITFTGSSVTQGAYNGATGLWTIGMLNDGAVAIITLTGTVDVGEGGNTITNITTAATGDQIDPSTVGDDLDESVAVDGNADLVTVKTLASGNPIPAYGEVVTFEIEVTNNGTAQATNVSLTDLLPTGLIATAVNGTVTQGTYDVATGLFDIGTLNAGQTATLTLEGTVDAATTITNITTAATGDQTDPSTDGDDLSESVDPLVIADLAIAKSIVGTPVLTDIGNYVVTYQVVIENTGNVDLGDLSLLEDLAAQFGSPFVQAGNLSLQVPPTNTGSSVAVDSAGWNGNSSIELLDGSTSSMLAVGDSFTVEFDVEIDPSFATTPLENQVEGAGEAINATGNPLTDSSDSPIVANDVSDSGTDPTTTNPGSPDDQGTPDDPTLFDPPARPLGEISGSVFEDLNNDGIQDPDEPGIPGVEVTLTGTDVLGNPVSITVVTDADGRYEFTDLNAGVYTLTQTQPIGFVDGIDNGDSAWTIGNDEFSNIVLGWGDSFTSGTFGEIPEVIDNGTSGNPPNFPSLGPIYRNPISSLLNGYLGGPGPIYSGIPIASSQNPLTLESGRPVTGGYSIDAASDEVECCEVVETVDPCCEETVPVEEVVEVECGCEPVSEEVCGEETEVASDCVVDPAMELDCCDELPIEEQPIEDCPPKFLRGPKFLQRMSSWLRR